MKLRESRGNMYGFIDGSKNKDLKMMFNPHPPECVFDADGNKYVLCHERENE
jgi:hypothetical protein